MLNVEIRRQASQVNRQLLQIKEALIQLSLDTLEICFPDFNCDINGSSDLPLLMKTYFCKGAVLAVPVKGADCLVP